MTDINDYVDNIEDCKILELDYEKLKKFDIESQHLILNVCKEYPNCHVTNKIQTSKYIIFSVIVLIILISMYLMFYRR